MAACTDLAYRLISREYGLEFCFLEMVSADSLVRGVEKTGVKMKTVPEDRPLGAQLVGCNPEIMAEGAALIEQMGYDLLDLNLGCPVPKIAGKGAGSALLDQPETCRQIFKAVTQKVKKIPVTVKMRLGVADPSGRESVEIAKIAEECGLSAVAVHGRTREQRYTGKADYEAIRRVKDAVKIPVIGNGDVHKPEDAQRMIEVSGCDGVMIGRGGLGNPWLFKRVADALEGRDPGPEPAFEEKKRALLRHLELELQHRPEHMVVLFMRRIGTWYFKGTRGSVEFRNRINCAQSIAEVRMLIEEFREDIPESRSALV